jgi:hypothetical protein
MRNGELDGWKKLLEGYPWLSKTERYTIRAYSEFMPPPRLGQRPYGDVDSSLFSDDDDYGWNISEIEEAYELQPGLVNLAHQIVGEVVELGQGKGAYRIFGHQGRNLVNNPYWPPELAAQAGKLPQEKYLTLLPLALSKTQDDKGRQRWTFFGSSEQGPEKAIWQSFFKCPGQELPAPNALSFWFDLLSTVYGESCSDLADLYQAGFRILLASRNDRFPYWNQNPLLSSVNALQWDENASAEAVRYLLTFRPFSLLPQAVRERYLSGKLVLLPFPGSLVFWGMPGYVRLQEEFPLAMQLPLLRLVSRNGGPDGLRVPQSGWFHESGRDDVPSEVQEKLLLNTYRRTSRWDRTRRYENEIIMSTIEDSIAKTLFSTDLNIMGLYGKPLACNSQIWTTDSHLLLDGPRATRIELAKAADTISRGGNFRYRFQFPPMQVGIHQVYWHRPLAAYWKADKSEVQLIDNAPLGYLTGYRMDKFDLENPVELWPRVQKRDFYHSALRNFEHLQEHYKHQTTMNIIRLLDLTRRWGGKPLPRSLARQVLRLPERQTLESWLAGLPEKSQDKEQGERLRQELESRLEAQSEYVRHAAQPGNGGADEVSQSLTFKYTARRSFEESWWRDILLFSQGEYINKNNGDCVEDPPTIASLRHHQRDLELLGDYLLDRHQKAIVAANMEGRAACGELSFHWYTDFDLAGFGGWKNNQEGRAHERDLVVVIPGKNRGEAVIMADHYDTAFMEDIYEKSRGGGGARISAAGADDNGSATATLLQAAPIFLEMARQGWLERDIWLVHLTGEEFPADCLGARRLCESLIEKNLRLDVAGGQVLDLSQARITGVYVLDMIGHNRDSFRDSFQISPGRGRNSLQLAYQAHLANEAWNSGAEQWNQSPERRGRGRSRRSQDGIEIPPAAEYPRLQGDVRLIEDPHSSLYNTDGQIFSDCGIPVVLFMENYDINRSGYHDKQDTPADIDLDYGSAVASIAIESVARAATQRKL